MLIYKAINIINGKCYIGQTIKKSLESRKNQHLLLSKKLDFVFYRAIRKYGKDSFKWEVLCECNSKEELNEMEFHYIKQYHSRTFQNGYNMTDGGSNGQWGMIQSDEYKQKVSGENHYLNKMSEEERQDWINNNMNGENHSHKKYLSEEEYQIWLDNHNRGKNNPNYGNPSRSNRGKDNYFHKLSDVDKKRMLDIRSKANAGKYLITFPNGNEKKIISLRKFCIENNINKTSMYNLTNGRRQSSVNGYWCERIQEVL